MREAAELGTEVDVKQRQTGVQMNSHEEINLQMQTGNSHVQREMEDFTQRRGLPPEM